MGISKFGVNLIASTCLFVEVLSKWFIGWPTGAAGHVFRAILATIGISAYLRLIFLLRRERRSRRLRSSQNQ